MSSSLLAGQRILVTGVVTRSSIAYHVAERAQQLGAEVLLTSFGRARRLTERAAVHLPASVDVLVLDTPADSAASAFLTSAYSFKALASALRPLMRVGGSLVALDFDATVAWPGYDWMGVAKAALEATGRYLARDLGPHAIRVNLISAGPLATVAASGIPGFDQLAGGWQRQAPLGWDAEDPRPVADAACFLLSDLSGAITGERLHVDGGFHAMGAPAGREEAADLEPVGWATSPDERL